MARAPTRLAGMECGGRAAIRLGLLGAAPVASPGAGGHCGLRPGAVAVAPSVGPFGCLWRGGAGRCIARSGLPSIRVRLGLGGRVAGAGAALLAARRPLGCGDAARRLAASRGVRLPGAPRRRGDRHTVARPAPEGGRSHLMGRLWRGAAAELGVQRPAPPRPVVPVSLGGALVGVGDGGTVALGDFCAGRPAATRRRIVGHRDSAGGAGRAHP